MKSFVMLSHHQIFLGDSIQRILDGSDVQHRVPDEQERVGKRQLGRPRH